ncbi:Tubulin/FtsZ, GTPase domain-containing protein [Catenaria anguillulae PL171]|uniref:Tubulin delta chain n=1 Tax=Catenaria anguillulae PL171 TaxID=765915 RepID=A0A1Y2HHM7_9FUNG|nr:Tubulin/FtsZ, GTPase domain-containing protein [Catenaria anguillulae PL171]
MLQTSKHNPTRSSGRRHSSIAAPPQRLKLTTDRQDACLRQRSISAPGPAPTDATKSPVIVIAIGQCGVTVAHNFFAQFGTQPHLYPAFFAQVNPSNPSAGPSQANASSIQPRPEKISSGASTVKDNPTTASRPFNSLTPSERDARIRRTLSVMLPTLASPSTSFRHSNPPPSDSAQYIPRAILLDTEPKVISHVVSMGGPRPSPKLPRAWRYHPKCAHWRAAGAANNWAYGYFVHGQDMWQTIVRGVRAQVKQAEESNPNQKAVFLVLHSVAGGTGSGVGTYITEQLRREYPESMIVNQVVWPFSSGEVIVQHYNVILTLSRLQKVSNLTLILFNDHLHQICTSRLALPSPGFDDLNPLISHTLKQILTTVSLHDLAASLRPSFLPPFALVYHVPQVPRAANEFTSVTWHGLLKPLKQMVVTHSPIDERLEWRTRPQSDAGSIVETMVVVLKGKGSKEMKGQLLELGNGGLNEADLFVGKRRVVVRSDGSDSGVLGIDKWAAVVCTSTAFRDHLAVSLKSVVKMHTCGAYSHQYVKYGLSNEDMEKAIAHCYQMLSAYRTAKGG